ncbi:uncharacterized protein LOC122666570 [Telopea speciosissima]|uniref:uncharacterized protein LOC122666570 n=1 Tax=Telopea speciosissima TaxID=54955 RepID=UPI001CC3A061|nr:uncharacterized protein LOC122666570 [Telopea speciosissima]
MAPSTSLLLFALSLSLVIFHSSCEKTSYKEIHLRDHSSLPFLHRLTPSPLDGYSSIRGVKHMVSCDRLRVASLSRWKIRSYANSCRVNLTPSVVIPEKLYSKIEVCFHRNSSLGLCQCVTDEWKSIHKGLWSASMSPYEDRYIDVKFNSEVTGSITVSIEEEFHQWRLIFLVFGFILLLLAPVVSNWVPFYYSSSMAVGVFLIILSLLFQLNLGSLLVQYFSMLVNSILVSFGLSEDMHNPVAIVVLVANVFAGAALGYGIVQKFVISEDGTVDVGVAEFVKWAMRVMAMIFILMSTFDTFLAMVSLASSWAICLLISSLKWRGSTSTRAELFSRSAKMASQRASQNSLRRSFALFDCPTKGLVISPSVKEPSCQQEQDYYSTFHKVPTRKWFSKNEYEDFTSESTRDAIAELASSHDFTNWIIENASRIQLLPDDNSDDSMESGSGSSEETVAEGGGGLNLFKWY